MRTILSVLAGVYALLSAPAFASPESEAGRVAEELSDPVRQAQIAGTAAAASEALLNVPVAPLARAIAQIEGYDPDYVDPDLRVGDLVDPATADAPREFAYRLPQMMGAMAGLAVAVEDMLPSLRALGDRIAYPYGGYDLYGDYYDYDYDY